MNNDLISREALKEHKFLTPQVKVIGGRRNGKMREQIIQAYKNGWNDAIDAIIDNAPSVEYPFYAEAYQTGYEEAKKDRPLYKGVLFVDDYGINKVIEVDENGTVTAERIIPRDTFIEAYNKFIRENIDDEHTDNS